jgi:hypothetical protein
MTGRKAGAFSRFLILLFLTLVPAAASHAQSPSLPSPFVLRQSAVQEQLSALPVAPGGLFAGPSAGVVPGTSRAETAQSLTRGVKRTRSADINPVYLRRMLGAEKLALADGDRVAGAPSQFVLNLFDDAAPHVVLLDSSVDNLGLTVLRGTVVGGGSTILVIDNGKVTAEVSAGARNFTIMPQADGTHRIAEVDKTARPQNHDDGIRPPRDSKDLKPIPPAGAPTPFERKSAVEKPAAGTTLTMLMVYTPGTLAALPNINAVLSLNAAYLNTALQNSQIDAQVQIVGVQQTTYTEPAGHDLGDVLDDATDMVGDFARIHQVRASVGADLIAVFSSAVDPATCGIAWRNDDLDSYSNLSPYTKYGISVISSSCVDGDTFAHEVGHNIGAHHDRFVVPDDQPGPTQYNFGYVDTARRFRDIMSYDDACASMRLVCTQVQYFSNPNITYNGAPLGVVYTAPDAADASKRMREIMPYVAQFSSLLSAPTTPLLSVLVSGTGTVTSSPAGISCGTTCSATFSSGQSVTLTATPAAGWRFQGWSGACTGTTTCTVAMSTARNVTATFVAAITFGPIFASGKSTSESFLRFINTGDTAGTVTVTLSDYNTGNVLTTWNSGTIAAHAAPQYPISALETGIPAATKPLYYVARVESTMTGGAQHILFKPGDGTLTNLSTCDANVTANAGQVSHVHSTITGAAGFPSSVFVVNTSTDDATATLGIYDYRDGAKLGTFPRSVAAKGQAVLSAATIETNAHITPISARPFYIVRIENDFPGFLQNLVNNTAVGVITDMTTICAFDTVPDPSATVPVLDAGPIYSTAQSDSQSFLRFLNTGSTAGTVAVTLRNYLTGDKLGQWISDPIAPNAAQQFTISMPETAVSGAKPQYYAAQIESQIAGSFAHILWKPSNGTLTNLSTCGAGIATDPQIAMDVDSSLTGAAGYPSTIVFNNTGTTATAVRVGIYRYNDGVKLGTYTTTSAVPANGQLHVSMDIIEAGAGITPQSNVPFYVVKVESPFTGFLQHLVNNQQASVLTDMTTICRLPARSATYADCSFFAGSGCNTAVGSTTIGELKEAGGYANYNVGLTAGQAYTLEVRGASTSDGTLVRPYLFVIRSGSVVAQSGSGGSGNNVRLSFTPTITGTYTLQVTAEIYSDNAGSFKVIVQ